MIKIDNNSDWLIQQERLNPKEPFILTKDHLLTYSEFSKSVNRTAHLLNEKGIVPGAHAAVLCNNSPEFVIYIFALWKLGAVPVPLNRRLTTAEIEKLFRLSGSSHLFVQQSLINKHNFSVSLNLHKILLDDTHDPEFKTPHHFAANNTALIMFTSGSTGNPKGVMLSFGNLYNSAAGADSLIDQTPNDRWLASLPFYHIGGFSIITRALLTGAKIGFPESLKTDNVIKAINNFHPTLASFVPVTLQRLIDNDIRPDKLRTIFLGGGPIDKTLVKEAIKTGWLIVKVYGSTETSSMIAAADFNDLKKDIASGAKPIGENKIFVCDNDGVPLANKQSGQIAVNSESVMKGYYNNPAETNKALRDGLYFTSDYGHIDDNGALFVEGRIDDIIISGGENINPKEIEEALLKHPEVDDAVVLKSTDDLWGEIPVAVVSCRLSLISGQLTEFLRNELSSFKIPKRIIITDYIPRNEMGKINKQELKEELGL